MTDSNSEPWPQTVEEAVDRLLSEMNDDDKALIRNTPHQDLIQFHHGWGTGIRNRFGLWQGNRALLDDCGESFPDNASMVIIEAVWKRLQGR